MNQIAASRPSRSRKHWFARVLPALTHASPLLAAAFRDAGLDLRRFAWDHSGTGLPFHPVKRGPLSRDRGRIAVVDAAGRLIPLTVIRRGDCLDMRASLGDGVTVTAARGFAWLELPGLLPETLIDALPGRRVTSLVSHGLLTAEHVIDVAMRAAAFDTTVVGFAASSVRLDEL